MGQLTAEGLSQRKALALVGVSRSTWQYRIAPRARVTDPLAHTDRAYPNRVSPVEQAVITERITAADDAGNSIYTAWHEALDAGDPIASLSTWHRTARRTRVRPHPPRVGTRSSAMPQFSADAPNQVWCWDISKLPGRWVGQWFNLYTIIDVFSRCVVGWRVEEHEDDELAAEMFRAAFAAEQAHPAMVHSDGGPSMMSDVLAELYTALGITRSKNRPRVSNDNPHMESWFKTFKTRSGYRRTGFAGLDSAREWAAATIEHYNTAHHHSALGGHHPREVHNGTWTVRHHRRQTALTALAQRHPERYRHPPRLPTPLTVSLNPANNHNP